MLLRSLAATRKDKVLNRGEVEKMPCRTFDQYAHLRCRVCNSGELCGNRLAMPVLLELT